MDEKALIKQLKNLQTIKPNGQWGFALKRGILGKEPESHFVSFAASPRFIKLSSAIGSLSAICLLVVVAFLGTVSNNVDYTELAQLANSLQVLEANLNTVAYNIDLQQEANADETLAIQKTVAGVLEQGRQTVATAKNKAKGIDKKAFVPKEFLAVLSRVENALSAMDKTSQGLEKETAEREITQLSDMVLNANQQALLEQAKEFYENGNYQQALIIIIELSYSK